MSAASESAKRLIEQYVQSGKTFTEAVDCAIDKTSHDVVYFTRIMPNKALAKVSRRRLRWLEARRAQF